MFKQGTRVRLISLDDPYTKLKEGDQGTVDHVDGIGQIHVFWDTGSTLALVPSEDKFELQTEEGWQRFPDEYYEE